MLPVGELVTSHLERLNHRQLHVLYLTCKGLRNQEIAHLLGVCERTVKGYMSGLFLIFDVTNRTELVGTIGEESIGELLAKATRAERNLPEGTERSDVYKRSSGA